MTVAVKVGSLVREISSSRVGRVMDKWGETLWLRPPGGGREWQVKRAKVEPISDLEAAVPGAQP